MNENLYRRLEPAEISELRARLVHSAEAVGIECWGEPQHRTRREWRWGSNNGSLALELRGRKRGIWCDRATGEGGDLLTALRQAHGGDFHAVLERACAITGYRPASWDQTLTAEQRERREHIAAASARRREAEQARAAAAAKRAEQQEINRNIRVAQFIAGNAVALEAGSLGDVYLTQTRGNRRATEWLSRKAEAMSDTMHAEADGAMRVGIVPLTELLLLQLDAARGDADAQHMVVIAIAAMQEVADAPQDQPTTCVCCTRPIRRGDRCNVGIILTVVRVAFPVCGRGGLTPERLDAAVADTMRRYWADDSAEQVLTQPGRRPGGCGRA